MKPVIDPVIVWFTGMSGTGKSTLAFALAYEIEKVRRHVEVLDGDKLRRSILNRGLGFSREDRDTNVRRVGFVARLLANHDVFVITATISPYAAIRKEIREEAVCNGIVFVEIFVDAPIRELKKRDTKGLYRAAERGNLQHLTGISDPYEKPESPELWILTHQHTIEECVNQILHYLKERRLIC